jgi:hypothetical protein
MVDHANKIRLLGGTPHRDSTDTGEWDSAKVRIFSYIWSPCIVELYAEYSVRIAFPAPDPNACRLTDVTVVTGI